MPAQTTIKNPGTYSHLQALEPAAYLNPANFIVELDAAYPHIGAEKYHEGLKIGKASRRVYVSANGCWGATGLDNSSTTSYEGIGYHTGTAELWRGILDSGCEIGVYRYTSTGHYAPEDGPVIIRAAI